MSPQRAHAGPLWTGNSVQQTSQIGTEESCGRGEPQRAQKAGRRAQPIASMGLRSTRATARHREVSDGGTSNISEPESLRKTHLTWVGAAECAPPCGQYTRTGRTIPRQLMKTVVSLQRSVISFQWSDVSIRGQRDSGDLDAYACSCSPIRPAEATHLASVGLILAARSDCGPRRLRPCDSRVRLPGWLRAMP